MDDKERLNFMKEIEDKELTISKLNNEISGLKISAKKSAKDFEKRINAAKNINGTVSEIEKLEETIKELNKTILEERSAHLLEISNIKMGKEQISKQLLELKEKQDQMIKDQDKSKNVMNKIKRQINLDKKEIKTTERFINREDEEREQIIVQRGEEKLQKLKEELDQRESKIDEKSKQIDKLYFNYQRIANANFEAEKQSIIDKFEEEKT